MREAARDEQRTKSIEFFVYFFIVQWTAAPLCDNLPIDTYHYLITVHTGIGKESATTSKVNFFIAGEETDSGVRQLTDGTIRVSVNIFVVEEQVSAILMVSIPSAVAQ